MAENRFKKSVDNATENTKTNITKNIKDNEPKNIIDSTIGNIPDNIISNTGNNILKKVLEKDKKDKGSNHTLYLSAEVGEELNKLAKKTKKSKSTLVDEILRAVFFEE